MLEPWFLKFLNGHVMRCPICEELKRIKINKNDQLVVKCELCGVRLSTKKEYGIQKLARKLHWELSRP